MTPEIEKRIKAVRAGRVPAGYKRTKVGIVPKDWGEVRFHDMFSRVVRKNKEGNTNVLTISAQYGLINQNEFFNKTVASDDKSNYYLMKKGEFAYNKSYSNGYPFGALKRLDFYDKGIVSPLYICFAASENNQCPDFYVHYFEAGLMNKEIQAFAQEGARNHGLLNISVDDFFNSNLLNPPLSEQKKIAEILATQDRVIELKEKLIAEKQNQKKYLSQILLTGKKRVGDYKDPWEYSALSNYLTIKDVRQIPNDEAPLMAFIAGIGVSPKGERYDRSFLVKNDKKEYKRTDLNDFIYSSNNLDVGSIGLNSYGSASISVVYEIFSVNSNAVPVVLSSIIQLPENLNYALRFRQGAIYGQYRIYAEDFLSMKIKIPSLPEQKAIADVLSAADEEILLMQKDLEQEKLKKKSLMQLLLTGLVRVNE
ncbi:restriction endonuclease subunit S [Fibrobacter sp.]|uniref:restriction endonuclease subunit S n=1 Tax=Fibrobacter sp. TaxID=35828 RepID=UPI0026287BF1|nr:restriction endonuclease subunit S [Fibrobacter sp.]MDD5942015.1 restriction endonuclease subunit S [Fibrobacter sp.]